MVSDKIWSIRTKCFHLNCQAKNVFPSDVERTVGVPRLRVMKHFVGIIFFMAIFTQNIETVMPEKSADPEGVLFYHKIFRLICRL